MEQMLNGFQSDLSSISTEIQSLQDQSIAMNIKLKNRQVMLRITDREYLLRNLLEY